MENLDHSNGLHEPLPLGTMAALQLLDLFRDPEHDVDRIVEFISRDPQLTAETLRRCNQAAFRGAERTTDLFEAVNRLGYYELYGIIVASLGRQMLPAGEAAAAERERVAITDLLGKP
jgi:HD-like signal output (HDOD) protein